MAVRFPAKKILSCIWVAIPVDWVISHWYACGVEGRVRVDGRMYSHMATSHYENFSDV